MNIVDYASTKFSNIELMEIAELVDVPVSNRMGSRFLIDMIVSKIEENGITTVSHPVLEDFLRVMLYTNDLGNFQTPNIDVELDEDLECYGFASDLDSKCSSCLVYQYCCNSLTNRIPDCFGILFGDEECTNCILSNTCQRACAFNVKTGFDKRTNMYEVRFFDEVPVLTNVLISMGIFRRVFKGWPSKILLSAYNRLKEFSFRGIEIKRSKNVFVDAIYLSPYKVPKDENIEIIPLRFEGERRPIVDNERIYFRERLR